MRVGAARFGAFHYSVLGSIAARCHGTNGADGVSDVEGKVARVATSKLGNKRVSIDRFITENGKGPYPDMEGSE